MPLPRSFTDAKLVTYDQARRQGRRFKRLMVICDGPWDSGKTEFALSAPGPGVMVALDRGFDAVADNPNPPATRTPLDQWGLQVISTLKQGQAKQDEFIRIWGEFRTACYAVCGIAEARTIIIDGDTDSWEIQRLATLGATAKIPPILYDTVNSERRGFYNRLFDSGKIVISTNRVRKRYAPKLNPVTGEPLLSDSGKEVREWDGTYEHQGFADTGYVWNIQLMHSKIDNETWAAEIVKCKSNPSVEGYQLVGEECCFQGLVQVVFPDVPLTEWGYPNV